MTLDEYIEENYERWDGICKNGRELRPEEARKVFSDLIRYGKEDAAFLGVVRVFMTNYGEEEILDE